MDFDKELDDLRVKVLDVQAAVRAAANETHGQIQERIGEAQVKLDKEAKAARAQAEQAGDQAQDQWLKVKADAAARIAKTKRGNRPPGRPVRRRYRRDGRHVGRERRRGGDRLRGLCRRKRARRDPRRDRCQSVLEAEGRGRPTGLSQPFEPAPPAA